LSGFYALIYKEKQKQAVAEWKEKNPHKASEYSRKWEKKNPEKVKRMWRTKHLKNKYGITVDDFEKLKIKQNHVCPICEKSLDNGEQIDVDHCHKNGTIRSVLHNKCNRLISCCREDIEILKNAIKYLEKYNI